MKKYMVIDCCEREIGEPEFFDTMLKAQIRMFEKFLKPINMWMKTVTITNSKSIPMMI